MTKEKRAAAERMRRAWRDPAQRAWRLAALAKGREESVKVVTKHGGYQTPEYRVWVAMRVRCQDETANAWERYGGRGIRVCDQWAGPTCFPVFLADMGPRPTPKHELERIDNDGNYEPGNCRWATRHDQMRNTGSNVLLTIGGQTKCAVDWAAVSGIPAHIIRRRVHDGWTHERAVYEPRAEHLVAKRPRNRFTGKAKRGEL